MPDAAQHPSRSLKSSLPWLSGIITGLISGVSLGFFLKAVQALTGEKVYTLLLNIDFVPGLPAHLPEWLEFSLHLGMSVVIGIFYIWWINRSGHPLSRGICLGAVSSLLYIPLAPLSTRVPDLNDVGAVLYWTAGHIVFGAVLGLCGKYVHAKKRPLVQ
ncbi:hypothetical protein [Paenibacillus silvae]|uniref:hypothetical protein n=1 Tax=Paenibacillus silvae TaxID=1325358 RepID=UPI0020053091|nr:hypothetical protein [Paenibacillus silvae]MCK6074790.1 hypothetical protein [Paenibacillus silvae]MCK6147735.1 hypothetical protein [Paenibacillus silvae]MCK6266033.1 hypothetical protein [Paenibacillus silvae]